MKIALHASLASLLLLVLGDAAVAQAPASAPPPPAAAVDPATLLTRVEKQDPELLVLDVRTAEEYAAGHVPGARNISHELLPARLAELADARDREIVVYCRSGRRSTIALQTLRAAGFTRVAQLPGDFLAWEAAQRPVERPPASPAASPQP